MIRTALNSTSTGASKKQVIEKLEASPLLDLTKGERPASQRYLCAVLRGRSRLRREGVHKQDLPR